MGAPVPGGPHTGWEGTRSFRVDSENALCEREKYRVPGGASGSSSLLNTFEINKEIVKLVHSQGRSTTFCFPCTLFIFPSPKLYDK